MSIWRQPLAMLVAIGLGVGAGLALGSPAAEDSPRLAAALPEHEPSVDVELLAAVWALRDEAEALTTAEVTLDERAHELWMPRVEMIERAREDPATPPAVRRELDATIAALECVGLLAASPSTTCATIER